MQKILVVDDAEINRELLREFPEVDYVVETAENGEQAMAVLCAQHDEISALLLDLHMPHSDGFAVIEQMRERGWMDSIPVLIISSEHAVEAENKCFELGVSDFIHRPFVDSIVKNRVKNTIELFNCKNQLERKIEKQSEALRRQEQIIRIQAEQLSTAESFNKLMMEYRCVIMEVETRLKVLNAMFSEQYKRNPFESIKSRLKKPESIYKKLVRKDCPVTVENIKEHIADVAGLRVICSFPDDI